MKREGGAAVGVLAVLTLLGVSNLPNKSGESPATAEPKKLSAITATRSSDRALKPYAPCREIARRLRRLVTDKPLELWELPKPCYESGSIMNLESVTALPGIRFAVATVPNPVSTHLPLMFDRFVEAIQQAAQDENYSYDASWFPWEASEKTYELLDDQLQKEELQEAQQSQPGVMVFRRAGTKDYSDGGLVVFVVGEQPTGGIADSQFDNALAWIAKLGGIPDGTLRVMGPSFSGSIPSLRRDLERDSGAYENLFVSSGAVSSPQSYEEFDKWIKDRADGSRFRTAIESDTVAVNRFCTYLVQQDYDLKFVAFLSEDETDFGSRSLDGACGDAISLHYPRDIATLRSAYQQQSIFNPAKAGPSASAPSTTLRGDLSEPSSNDHDTVRSYAGQLTPLAQESVLLDIANRLNEKHIQFIILRSTSSLDQIFLSQFLRRSFPQGRVVIAGADLLFSRGAEGKSLRGVMLLSTYPLLTAEQDWTASLLVKPSGGYRTFGEDMSEGEYIAARELFQSDTSGDKAPVPVRDYGPPAWASDPGGGREENQRPVTWISVIARRQFWPLAALNSYTLKPSSDSADVGLKGTLPSFLDLPFIAPINGGDPSPLYLPTSMRMFLLACIAGSLIHLYFCCKGSIMASPRARAYFAPLDRPEHPALIATGSVILAMLGIAVAAASGLFSWMAGGHPFHELWTGFSLLIFVLLSLAVPIGACWRNYKLTPVRASDKTPGAEGADWSRYWSRAGIIALCFWAVFAVYQGYLVYKLTLANRIPAYLRSVNLTSGVSGLLPEILLLTGAYLWFLFNLRGLAHFGDDRPRLPRKADMPMLDKDTSRLPMFSDEVAGEPVVKMALPLTRFGLLMAVFAVTWLVFEIALEDRSVGTLGERRFGTFIFFWICFYVAVLLNDGVQMWRVWSDLRQLLVYLDRLTLRRTLRALKGLEWGSIWKMSGNVLDERYRVISLQIESLRHLGNTIRAWEPTDPKELEHKSDLLPAIDKCQDDILPFATWYVTLKKDEPVRDVTALRNFQVELASVAGAVMKHVLMPAWSKETDSLIFRHSTPDAKEDTPADHEVPTKDLKPHVRAAEEFFVLPYLAFIRNILGRIRTIALGMVWLFVGATLAASSYPFEPLSVLGGIFLSVFVLIAGLMVLVYSQMSRDATLSHITNTNPGELGVEFWVRLVGFGVGPLIGLLTTLFPSITDFMFSWLQPGMQSLK